MPRPPDTYTHAQFEPIESDNIGETVRCIHCKQWQGSVKILNRKKEHLLRCPQYSDWRAAGNGQDLPPANQYTKRDSFPAFVQDSLERPSPTQSMTPGSGNKIRPWVTQRLPLDSSKYFDEFADPDGSQKCNRVRCHACGYVRAKNATRMSEHLMRCTEFLNSPEGEQAIAQAQGRISSTSTPIMGSGPTRDIWRGQAPNPNLTINPGPKIRWHPSGNHSHPDARMPGSMHSSNSLLGSANDPSLVRYLLSKDPAAVDTATQNAFMARVGTGGLSHEAISQCLAELRHISRALLPFIGSLLGKIRLPEEGNLHQDSTFRALDLLCSAVSNVKKELEFFEAIKADFKVNDITPREPSPATRGLVDLLASSTSGSATFLEGMVVLWAVEFLLSASFRYAASCQPHRSAISKSPSLPSYLAGLPSNTHAHPPGPEQMPHTHATPNALIENWTSETFLLVVEACRAIVDELAVAQNSGHGYRDMIACERVFRQSVWLWGKIWPQVDDGGEKAAALGEQPSVETTQDHLPDATPHEDGHVDDEDEGEQPVAEENGDTAIESDNASAAS